MKIATILLPHVLRPSGTKQGKVSELVQQLRKIYNHQRAFPTPKKPTTIEMDLSQLSAIPLTTNKIKLKDTKEYKRLVSDTRQQVWDEFAKKERENAYPIRQSYTANGGIFSYGQQLANRSGSNVIGDISGQRKEISSNTSYFGHKLNCSKSSAIWVIIF